MSDSISISNVQATQRLLYQFSNKLGDRITRLALRSGANYMLKRVRLAAPKKTGRLRRAIVVKNSKVSRRRNGKVGVYITISKRRNRGAFYGRFIEGGFNHGRSRVPGRFFIRRTYNRTKRQSVRLVVRNIENAGRQLARQMGG